MTIDLAGMRAAVARFDEAERTCPVNNPIPNRKSERDGRCVACGATSSQGCGPLTTAAYKVANLARSLIQETTND